MARIVDAEGAHLAAILRAADFRGRRVLEVGSGEGRLTWGFAPLAASVLAFDPGEAVVAAARDDCADELREKICFEVARAEEIEVPPQSVDLVFFSWSLWWMEPEGVVDVLRRLLRSLVPGGIVVDLLSVPPPERVEVGSLVLGELDGSAFFPRALAAAAGLDALASEGVLAHEYEERFPVFVRYPTGVDLVEDVSKREYTRMPTSLGRRVRAIDGPCAIRDSCLVRRFRKPPREGATGPAWKPSPSPPGRRT